MNESWMKTILNEISLKYVPNGLIDNITASIRVMAWRRTGDKPLSERMFYVLLSHICVIRPKGVVYANTIAILAAVYGFCCKIPWEDGVIS